MTERTLLERMSDIAAVVGGNVEAVLIDAAEEIERLRTELAEVRHGAGVANDTIKALQSAVIYWKEQKEPGAAGWRAIAKNLRAQIETMKIERQFESTTPPTIPDEWRTLVVDLLRFAENHICTHEQTHRGGTIWEICDYCGAKWADDEGGKPEFEWPEVVTRACDMLSK